MIPSTRIVIPVACGGLPAPRILVFVRHDGGDGDPVDCALLLFEWFRKVKAVVELVFVRFIRVQDCGNIHLLKPPYLLFTEEFSRMAVTLINSSRHIFVDADHEAFDHGRVRLWLLALCFPSDVRAPEVNVRHRSRVSAIPVVSYNRFFFCRLDVHSVFHIRWLTPFDVQTGYGRICARICPHTGGRQCENYD